MYRCQRSFQCPFGHSGILTWGGVDLQGQAPRFQCPFGHSGILTCFGLAAQRACGPSVSMPFRAFGDSDLGCGIDSLPQPALVSMPFRAFGDSDAVEVAGRYRRSIEFQCPFGHSGILTNLEGG